MAIWQFTFHLAPRVSVEKIDGTSALVIGAFRPTNSDEGEAESEVSPNYWTACSPKSHAAIVGDLLPLRASWSADALMFGDERTDSIELWDDAFRVRLDMRQFNEPLALAITNLAADSDLKFVMAQTGRLAAPKYANLMREISQSRALKFAQDPVATLQMISKEWD